MYEPVPPPPGGPRTPGGPGTPEKNASTPLFFMLCRQQLLFRIPIRNHRSLHIRASCVLPFVYQETDTDKASTHQGLLADRFGPEVQEDLAQFPEWYCLVVLEYRPGLVVLVVPEVLEVPLDRHPVVPLDLVLLKNK